MIPVFVGGSLLVSAALPYFAMRARQRRAPTAPAKPPIKVMPAEVTYFEKTPEAAPPPSAGFAPEAPKETRDGSLSVLVQGGLAYASGNYLMAGAAAAELSGRIVEDGLNRGEGQGDLARATGALPAFLAAEGARRGAEALGVRDEKALKGIEQTAAAAAIFPPLALPVAAIHAISAGLREISPEADKAVRDFVDDFDPSIPTTAPGQVVQAIGNFTESLFGGGEKPWTQVPATLPVEESRKVDALEETVKAEASARAKTVGKKLPKYKEIPGAFE